MCKAQSNTAITKGSLEIDCRQLLDEKTIASSSTVDVRYALLLAIVIELPIQAILLALLDLTYVCVWKGTTFCEFIVILCMLAAQAEHSHSNPPLDILMRKQ